MNHYRVSAFINFIILNLPWSFPLAFHWSFLSFYILFLPLYLCLLHHLRNNINISIFYFLYLSTTPNQPATPNLTQWQPKLSLMQKHCSEELNLLLCKLIILTLSLPECKHICDKQRVNRVLDSRLHKWMSASHHDEVYHTGCEQVSALTHILFLLTVHLRSHEGSSTTCSWGERLGGAKPKIWYFEVVLWVD